MMTTKKFPIATVNKLNADMNDLKFNGAYGKQTKINIR